ncbi:hypothetical protein TREMEDRAFT_57985 [Tremella mesenterica DSM 1558]|uniref:uncharacterized protein n=1 Tax=Tremella mesenterica (strain ATCC 24925 / CBS 8224 / DSM 1558 / NBRC 9311 / NRRL Y-6157 / RJB 2259-6 / UBC 559-6) TaxID=578456 RepID=UPI00032D1508|nr:uncharacterized protein TREMEDRAFT_57985 [Tremella mesenterica DSM 1558]EIW65562.1 hypothetical protein TREMEDRAFT_57985 [Tremella mesenterica DSM 1558]
MILSDQGDVVEEPKDLDHGVKLSLVQAYRRLHHAGVLHRDVAARNWCMTTMGHPTLNDKTNMIDSEIPTSTTPTTEGEIDLVPTVSIIDFGISIHRDQTHVDQAQWDRSCEAELKTVRFDRNGCFE